MNDAWAERQNRPRRESEQKKQTQIGGGREKREEGAKNGRDDKGSAKLGAERSERWACGWVGGRTSDGGLAEPRLLHKNGEDPPAHAPAFAPRTRLSPRGARACLHVAQVPASMAQALASNCAKELARSGGNRCSKKWRRDIHKSSIII